jgi:hypothetical protein
VVDQHQALRIPSWENQAESLMHRSPGQHAPGKQEAQNPSGCRPDTGRVSNIKRYTIPTATLSCQ